jgi:DHA2 family multidrug resistance protein
VIDFRVLRHRQMWVGTILGVIMGVGLFASVFTLPVFLQGNLRMTAEQTGIVLLPGALTTALSMAFVGRMTQRSDPRLLIAAGAGFFALAMVQLSRITGESGAHDFFWPLIWRGLGLGMMFVPLTNITLADLAPREIAAGAALSNFFRQLGGSLGIAAMATMLTHFTQQARAVLVEHVTAYDPVSIERVSMLTRGFMSRGADAMTARQLALGVIDRQVLGQANVIAFGKVYLLSGAILLATLPLLLLVRKTRPTGGGAGAVHAE